MMTKEFIILKVKILLNSEIQTCIKRFNKWKLNYKNTNLKTFLSWKHKTLKPTKIKQPWCYAIMLPTHQSKPPQKKNRKKELCVWFFHWTALQHSIHTKNEEKNKRKQKGWKGSVCIYQINSLVLDLFKSDGSLVPSHVFLFSKDKRGTAKNNKFSRQKGIKKIKGPLNENSVSQEKKVNEWKER